MKSKLIALFLFATFFGFAQNQKPAIFDRIDAEMRTFKVDTSSVPQDKLTAEIQKLRNLKGGFNINEAMEYKIEESRQKGEISQAESQKMKAFLIDGNGKKWLDNAVVWIYRKQFTLEEVKDLVQFYKSSAGQKMAQTFPVIMAQSVKASEFVGELYKKRTK